MILDKYQLKEIGPLKALIIETGSHPILNIVLFHGYGANAMNLFPLHRYLEMAYPIRWIFPEGVHDIPNDPSGLGRAWFPLNIDALMASKKETYQVDSTKLDLIVEKAYEALQSFCRDEYLIIGGFSQGAMLATNLAMKTDLKLKALLVLSGILLDAKHWGAGPSSVSREGLPFFQSHGYSDAILSYRGGQKLEDALKKNGLKGSLFGFEGGHEIPVDVLNQIKIFLQEQTPP